MKLRISRAALDAIVAEASRTGTEECCGLLLADPGAPPGHIDSVLPAANVAADRRARFEIDPTTLLTAHKAARTGGPMIVGCYHSHPRGDPSPSPEDAAQAEPNGAFWLIAAGPPWTVTAWRAGTKGVIHGRFDAAEIVTDPGP